MSAAVRKIILLFAFVASTVSCFSPAMTHQRANAATLLWGVSSPMSMAGPAVLDRPAVLERPETAERTLERNPTKERKGMGGEAWEVRIYNDGLNTREHVARSLVQITGKTEMEAYQTMMQAHQNGIAVVGRWVYEVAEMYAEGLKKNGIVADMVPVDEEK